MEETKNLTLNETPRAEEPEKEEALSDRVRVISPGRMVLKRFFRSKLSVIGLCLMLFLFLFSFIGPLFTGWEQNEIDRSIRQVVYSPSQLTDDCYYVGEVENTVAKLAPPMSRSEDGRIHILGTDKDGRDNFTRLMYGGRISLTLSLAVVIINTIIGVIIGGLAGYIGKWLDMIVMRIIDVINCIPTLPILLIVSAILDAYKDVIDPQYNIYIMMGILTLLSWTGIARLVRGQILFLREQEYMLAAEAGGFSTGRKVFRHLIPNIIPQLIVSMTLSLGSMILYESTLAYLGLGVPAPNASWGRMVNLAKDPEILANYINVWAPPGLCIILAVLGFNFVGDGLRAAFDPKMKR